MRGYVNVLDVVEFVDRTRAHGVPQRIAYQRAARKFGLAVGTIRSVYVGTRT